MNKNQRHRRMKAKRRDCIAVWGVNRVNQLRPRTGIEVQLLQERAQRRVRRRKIVLNKILGISELDIEVEPYGMKGVSSENGSS